MHDDYPNLLLITWNRHEYLRKTLDNLLADTANFRVLWWDNASEGETRELFETTRDPRIVGRHRSEANVGQQEPFFWFLENATSDIVGKIDDDILLPHGWTERLSAMLNVAPELGMLGCWIFMESDWVPELASTNTIETAAGSVLRMTSLAGHSFLMRRSLAEKYVIRSNYGHGIPLGRHQMTLDGHISGTPLPLMFAHNMDDPRSEHCVGRSSDGKLSALTARSLGFESVDDYSRWIEKDARDRLTIPFDKQVRRIRLDRRKDLLGRVARKLRQATGTW